MSSPITRAAVIKPDRENWEELEKVGVCTIWLLPVGFHCVTKPGVVIRMVPDYSQAKGIAEGYNLGRALG